MKCRNDYFKSASAIQDKADGRYAFHG